MAYVGQLGGSQVVYLDNLGQQTIVTVSTTGLGQQQQASSSFQTGSWVKIPELYSLANGVLLKVIASQGEYFIQIQGHQIALGGAVSASQQLRSIPIEVVDQMPNITMQPMQPLEPLKPLSMGNMQMSLNPMEMRMGTMEMRIGQPSSPPEAEAGTHRFCSQCGTSVKPNDRFCTNCGNRLS